MVEKHSFSNSVCRYKQLQRNSIKDKFKRVVTYHRIVFRLGWCCCSDQQLKLYFYCWRINVILKEKTSCELSVEDFKYNRV